MFDEWYIYHVMLCECFVLRKKKIIIAPRCGGKFWKIFYSVQNWNKNEKE